MQLDELRITRHHERLVDWAEKLGILDMDKLSVIDELWWEAFGAGMDAAVEGMIDAKQEA